VGTDVSVLRSPYLESNPKTEAIGWEEEKTQLLKRSTTEDGGEKNGYRSLKGLRELRDRHLTKKKKGLVRGDDREGVKQQGTHYPVYRTIGR